MEEIRRDCPDVELECFMHGAMCMSYSGRCLISNFMADRSANKGKCAHTYTPLDIENLQRLYYYNKAYEIY